MGLRFVSAPFPGVLRWLQSGEALGLWGLTVLEDGKRAEIPAAEAYGVGAWHPAYDEVCRGVRGVGGASFGVAWSSSPQESDTARTREELAFLMALTKTTGSGPRPDWWACLHPALAQVLPNGVHLPAPIHMERFERSREAWVGMFLPPTEKKCIFAQLLAVRLFQRQQGGSVQLHTNLEAYQGVMDWLGLDYVLHPWLPRPEYLELLARCRVVLHASLAESFGYGAVDAMMAGARVVGSPALGWLPDAWMAVDANDPRAVVSVLERLWDSAAQPDPVEWVRGVAGRNNEAARVAVERILSIKVK